MAMMHKAYVFKYNEFQKELRPILERAFYKESCEELIDFIKNNKEVLVDPYEGVPLDVNWESLVDEETPEQYADFCMTKYYNPACDLGLDYEWLDIQNILEEVTKEASEIVLGTPLEFGGVFFDPGKMGSYFSSPEQVDSNLSEIKKIRNIVEEGCSNKLLLIESILMNAHGSGEGLYVTF